MSFWSVHLEHFVKLETTSDYEESYIVEIMECKKFIANEVLLSLADFSFSHSVNHSFIHFLNINSLRSFCLQRQ